MESIDDVLHLSQRFSILSKEPGLLLVEFVFAIVWQLLDASLDDEGLLDLVPEKKSTWSIKPQEMEIDDHNFGEKKMDRSDRLYKTNTTLAIEIIGELYQNKITSRILYLARLNMWVFLFFFLLLLLSFFIYKFPQELFPFIYMVNFDHLWSKNSNIFLF